MLNWHGAAGGSADFSLIANKFLFTFFPLALSESLAQLKCDL